ncbi:MAG: M20 family metallopeptidase [Candidatus Hermodarchaeota archaeon]
MIPSDSLMILKELVRLKSVNPPGNTRPIIKWIQDWADKNQIYVETQWIEKNKANIILSLGESKKNIVICGHLDTVPIGDPKNWQHDPLGANEEDGYIWGRGSADMKGGIAACLAALKSLKNTADAKNLDYKIVFLGTSDEEIDFKGAKSAVDHNIMNNAEFLIIPEPTGLEVGIAEKGILWLVIRSIGKAAHGSTPEKGINAIEELTKLFPQLHAEVPTYYHKVLGQSTLNIGIITGGKSTNVVPEKAEIHCDFRLVPPINPFEYAKKIDRLIRKHDKTSPARFKTEIKQKYEAVQSSKENKFVKLFLEIANRKDVIGVNYATDAAVLITTPSKYVPFVLFGPGDPNAIHVANERVSVREVIEAESILLKFLMKINKIR